MVQGRKASAELRGDVRPGKASAELMEGAESAEELQGGSLSRYGVERGRS